MKKYFYLLLALPSLSLASQCPGLYPNETPIVVTRATELCNSFYVSVFDTMNRSVLFTSERLRKSAPVGEMNRIDHFHSDRRVPRSPTNNQYKGTGYDRGHMVPSDDASTAIELDETFLLTNMTPQVPSLNRSAWKRLEIKVRKVFETAKTDVFVLTIAVYNDGQTMNGIRIPTGYWKVVYVDGRKAFYYADNAPNAKVVQKNAVDVRSLIK